MNLKFIHIGHHRCGSTFLQKKVFPSIQSLTPITYYNNHGIQDAIDRLILEPDPFYPEEETAAEILEKIEPLGDACMSYEGFTGLNEGMGFCYQNDYIAKRLRAMFGEKPILFVVREQKGHLISRYRTRVRKGVLADFETWTREWLASYRLNFLRYSAIADIYGKHFGAENVHVVLFEELFDAEYLSSVFRRFDVDPAGIEAVDFGRQVNESDTAPVMHMTRFVNRFFGSKVTYEGSVGANDSLRMYNWWRYKGAAGLNRWTRKMGSDAPTYDFPGFDELLHDLCHEDNKKLSALTGKDLTPFGYV